MVFMQGKCRYTRNLTLVYTKLLKHICCNRDLLNFGGSQVIRRNKQVKGINNNNNFRNSNNFRLTEDRFNRHNFLVTDGH